MIIIGIFFIDVIFFIVFNFCMFEFKLNVSNDVLVIDDWLFVFIFY